MMKPTIALLVVVTAVPAMVMAAQGLPDPIVFIATLVGTMMSAAAAGVFNQVIDADIDLTMQRTKSRPLPTQQVSKPQAVSFGALLTGASFILLYEAASPLAAWISLAANAFYVVIYTIILKRRTVQNIVIGGAAGAVGPLIGWAAITNTLAWPAWALFIIIFLWTPSHFWALAIKYKDDYASANVPMLPVVKGEENTRFQIFIYGLTLLPPVIWLYAGGAAGLVYLIPALVLTLIYCYKCAKLYFSHSSASAMNVFLYSCVYLFALFAVLSVDQALLLF